MKQLLLALSSAMLFSATCFGQNTIEYSPVVVTAKRLAADAIDTKFQTGHVTVIPRESFETSMATVADVLTKETGVQIRQVGGLGSFSSVSVRGSSSAQVNVYLDGVLINGAYGGAVDLSQFLLGGVEQIEIYRGNTPVQLGTSGIGGAIHIKTLKNKGVADKHLNVGYSSFETKKLAAMATDKMGETNYLAAIEYLASENDFKLDDGSGEVVEKRHNAEFSQMSGLISADQALTQKVSWHLTTQHFNKKQQLPELTNNILNKSSLDNEFSSAQLKLDYWYQPESTFSFKLFGSEKNEFFDDPEGSIGFGVNREEGNTTVFGGAFQGSQVLGSHLLNVNLEREVQRYRIESFTDVFTNRYQRVKNTLGLQDEWVSNDGTWLVNFGGRLFYLDDELNRNVAQNSELHHSLQSGVAVTLNKLFQLRANLSKDIRLPLLSELYGDRGYSVGNEELVPEQALNADFGVQFKQEEAFQASATMFYRALEDAIILIFDSRGTGRADNVSKARVMGVEFDVNYQPAEHLNFILKTTVQDSEDLSDSRQVGGKSLPGVSTLSSYLASTLTHGAVQLTMEYVHQSGGYYERREISAIKELNQVNLMAKWTQKQQALELGLENITNEATEEFNRFPGPGRRVFVVYKQGF